MTKTVTVAKNAPEKPRLLLPSKAKPSKALSRESLRPTLQRAHVIEPNGHRELVVTDSYKLARIRVGAGVPLGAIAPEALKRVERGETHEITKDGAFRFKGVDGTPIDYLAPEQEPLFKGGAGPEFDPGERDVVSVDLNPQLLIELAEAIGCKTAVRLEFAIESDGAHAHLGMRVRHQQFKDGDPEGLLMPMRRDKR